MTKQTGKVAINLRVPEELRDDFKLTALKNKKTMQDVLEELMKRYIETKGKEQ